MPYYILSYLFFLSTPDFVLTPQTRETSTFYLEKKKILKVIAGSPILKVSPIEEVKVLLTTIESIALQYSTSPFLLVIKGSKVYAKPNRLMTALLSGLENMDPKVRSYLLSYISRHLYLYSWNPYQLKMLLKALKTRLRIETVPTIKNQFKELIHTVSLIRRIKSYTILRGMEIFKKNCKSPHSPICRSTIKEIIAPYMMYPISKKIKLLNTLNMVWEMGTLWHKSYALAILTALIPYMPPNLKPFANQILNKMKTDLIPCEVYHSLLKGTNISG